MCAGGIVGILMSLVYYRAFGAPRAWLDVKARGTWRVGEQTGRRSSATGDASAESTGRRLQQDTGSLLLTQGGGSVLLLLDELLRVYLSYTTGYLVSAVLSCSRSSSTAGQQSDRRNCCCCCCCVGSNLEFNLPDRCCTTCEWRGSCCCCCWEGEEQQRLPLVRVRRQSRLAIPPSHRHKMIKWLQAYQ